MRQIDHRIAANGLVHSVREALPYNDGAGAAPVAILLHGFPDCAAVWAELTPFLVAEGYRVIAPDLRGFGDTDIPKRLADYDIMTGAVPDVLAIMDHLHIARAHLVGHDFGAPVAWALAGDHPERFATLAALSVGHFRAFLAAGPEQKRRSFYILVHQLRGLCEWLYRRKNWSILRRQWAGTADVDAMIERLARPGRLTAGLDWYRANIPVRRMLFPPRIGEFGAETIRIPTLGVWSAGEPYLVEAQMTGSARHVDAPWTYARIEAAGHWLQKDAPEALAALLLGHWRAHPIAAAG